MMIAKRSLRKRISTIGLCLIAWLSLGIISTDPPSARGEQTWATCTPVETMLYHSRLHVRCAESVGGIYYFALASSDPLAPLFLSVIETAHVAGRTIKVLYDPADLSGSSMSCDNSNCRLMIAVGFE